MKRLLILILFIPILCQGQDIGIYKSPESHNINEVRGYNILSAKNSEFSSATTDWVTAAGSLVPDVTTYPGYMFLNTSSGNQAVKLIDSSMMGNDLYIEIQIQLLSGDSTVLHIGPSFPTSIIENTGFRIFPSLKEKVYGYTIRDNAIPIIYLGAISAYNNGSDYLIDYIKIYIIKRENEYASLDWIQDKPNVLRVSNWTNDIKNHVGSIYKMAMIGNSIMANALGGNIAGAVDEGAGMRPPRLTYNNVARRLYDYLLDTVLINYGYDKATFRRTDHADWSFTGSWSNTNGTGIVDPVYASGNVTFWKYTQAPGAYAEITIPTGYENCAVILRKAVSLEDTVIVHLNDTSISNLGDTLINTAKVRYSTSDIGDPFFYQVYEGLNSSVTNKITLIKGDDATFFYLWGICYWTGKTLILSNYGLGGAETNWIVQKYLSPLIYNTAINYIQYLNYDGIIIEALTMNDAGDNQTLKQIQQYNEILINGLNYCDNILIFTPNPFGDYSGTNYYSANTDPVTMETISNRVKLIAYMHPANISFINTFDMFKKYYKSLGYTLEIGKGTKIDTDDGIHPNASGCNRYYQWLKTYIK